RSPASDTWALSAWLCSGRGGGGLQDKPTSRYIFRMNTAVEAPAPTPQRERRARTRSDVLRAAARVFAERGYHGATLDGVVAEAGLSKGALYHYFPSKQDLFLALLEERLGAGISDVEAVVAEGGMEQQQ